jgi:hypothetical protein
MSFGISVASVVLPASRDCPIRMTGPSSRRRCRLARRRGTECGSILDRSSFDAINCEEMVESPVVRARDEPGPVGRCAAVAHRVSEMTEAVDTHGEREPRGVE